MEINDFISAAKETSDCFTNIVPIDSLTNVKICNESLASEFVMCKSGKSTQNIHTTFMILRSRLIAAPAQRQRYVCDSFKIW